MNLFKGRVYFLFLYPMGRRRVVDHEDVFGFINHYSKSYFESNTCKEIMPEVTGAAVGSPHPVERNVMP